MARARAEAITLGDLLVLASERFGDQVVFDDGSSTSTYAELYAAAAAICGHLVDAGVPRYARVGVSATAQPQRSAALLGIALAGTVAVPLGPDEDLTAAAARLRLRALVADASNSSTQADLPVIELDSWRGADAGADRLGETELQLRRLGARLRDPVVVAAVDGPRSVRAVLTHEALVRSWRAWALLSGLGPGERLWCAEPPSQLAGVGPLIACLSSGATWVAAPSAATVGLIVASSPPPLAEGTPDRLLRAYGPVEAGGLACASIDARPLPGDAEDPQLCGPPLPGVLVRIADDDEILIRGYNLADGYLDDEAGPRTLQNGWLHTGDRGRLDERGRLRMVPA